MTDPVPVLNQRRPIERQLMIKIRDCAGVGEGSEHGARHIAGKQLAGGEYHRTQEPQRNQGESGALDQDSADRHRLSAVAADFNNSRGMMPSRVSAARLRR